MSVDKAWKVKYELKHGSLIKDGHTMFLEDAVKDLNYYYNRYTQGQKTLSPEVYEKIIKNLLSIKWPERFTDFNRGVDFCINEINKLMEAGE